MRAILLAALLAVPTLAFVTPAQAAPTCGAPDEHLNLVDLDVWYGSGGCYGVNQDSVFLACTILWIGVDRPYAIAGTRLCRTAVIVQP